ncbi:MAG: hypothetical protein E7298_06620 [Lachnospiraceae bacterium]|nr:hypothetical protein [Lachnospiraceae bacterium]
MSEIGEFREEFNEFVQEVRQGFKFFNQQFEQIDKRFEQIDKRFEHVDQRFDRLEQRMDANDKQHEAMIRRLDNLEKESVLIYSTMGELHQESMNRMDKQDNRFDRIESHLKEKWNNPDVLIRLKAVEEVVANHFQ